MPNLDGTGPLGKGPMTGRCEGYCILKKFSLGNKVVAEGYIGKNGYPFHFTNSMFTENRKEAIEMPAGDRTGPMGSGPMTGRAAGYCAGYSLPGYMNPNLNTRANYYGNPVAYGLGPSYPLPYTSVPNRLGRVWGYGRGRRGGRRGGGFRGNW